MATRAAAAAPPLPTAGKRVAAAAAHVLAFSKAKLGELEKKKKIFASHSLLCIGAHSLS